MRTLVVAAAVSGCVPGSGSETALVVPLGLTISDDALRSIDLGGIGIACGACSRSSPDEAGAPLGMIVSEMSVGIAEQGDAYMLSRLYYEDRSRRLSFPVGIGLAYAAEDGDATWDYLASVGAAYRWMVGERTFARLEVAALLGAQGTSGLVTQWSMIWQH